jgi:hypothetical protein
VGGRLSGAACEALAEEGGPVAQKLADRGCSEAYEKAKEALENDDDDQDDD